jgi:magnesium transporter
MMTMMELLPEDKAARIRSIISDLESTADALISSDFVAAKASVSVSAILSDIRRSGHDSHSISYIYLVDDHGTLVGVVDLREIVLAEDATLLCD